ncbi:hypothetical protein DYY67_0652 [Candidatus Nitrosotalea sp. TS]|nr:hypothetical protein [Candidatus Nitrosotalea sp. TS]
MPQKAKTGDLVVLVGTTKDELGGSEYYEYVHGIIGGKCPAVDMESSKENQAAVLDVIHQDLVKAVHDCSKGGIGVAMSELCITNEIGCHVFLDKVPSEKLSPDELLFSESHSRFLLTVEPSKIKKVKSLLEKRGVQNEIIGKFAGRSIIFKNKTKPVASVMVDKAQEKWLNSLGALVSHG